MNHDSRLSQANIQSGFLMIEILLALGILGMFAAAFSGFFAKSFKATSRLEQISEKEQLRLAIINGINCNETMKLATDCSSTSYGQDHGFMKLKKKNALGVVDLFGQDLDNSGAFRYGSLIVRATCSNAESSLIVQAIPRYRNGNALTDQAINWNTPEALIFGGEIGIPLCYNASRVGSSLQASISNFEVMDFPPNSAKVFTPAPGLSDRQNVGIECQSTEGYRLTGCWIEVDNPKTSAEFKVMTEGDKCYAFSLRPSPDVSPINLKLTVSCLKAE